MLISSLRASAMVCPGFLILVFWARIANAEFGTDVAEAVKALEPVLKAAEELVVEGRLDEANQQLLDVFPKDSRTPAQSFALGNVLFTQNPEASYELHQQAAKALPGEFEVQFEWALEQHRAGKYEGAAASYAKCIASRPGVATLHGLAAECLIRQGKTRDAAISWRRSERAQGSITQFESLVCAVNGGLYPDRDRFKYREKVRKGDLDAAEKLIALDTDFRIDWWNAPTRPEYLKPDLALLRQTEFADKKRTREILCAAACGLARPEGKSAVEKVLREYKYLVDDGESLPDSGVMLSCMLGTAESTRLIDTKAVREKWTARLLPKARDAKDAELFNVLAHMWVGSERIAGIETTAWEITRSERFAAGLLLEKMQKNKDLTLETPELVEAAKAFPENSTIAMLVVQLTAAAEKPLEGALVSAIKAEFKKFSIPRLRVRPGAATLRAYFRKLAEELKLDNGDGG